MAGISEDRKLDGPAWIGRRIVPRGEVAAGLSGAIRLFKPAMLACRQDVGGQELFVVMDRQFEPIGQHGAEHEAARTGGRSRRNDRIDVVAIHLDPTRAAADALGVHIVGHANQIEHVGEMEFIAIAAEKGSANHRLRGVGTDVDLNRLEFGLWRLGEGARGEKGHTGEESKHGS